MHVKEGDTIRKLHEMITEKTGRVPICQQILCYRDHQLQTDDNRICDIAPSLANVLDMQLIIQVSLRVTLLTGNF